MTFLGLWVNKDGSLVDYNTKNVIEHNFIDKRLRMMLHRNDVCFEENYNNWDK